MDVTQLEYLASLRLLVGYLGEREHFGWWQSSFFAPGSQAFLAPLFTRTRLLASGSGVTQAAALVHDERIGVGHVYHLFRLPEDMEQGIHYILQDQEACARVEVKLADQSGALATMRDMAGPPAKLGIGPSRIGGSSDLRTMAVWSVAAAHYLYAFEHGIQVFPYLTESA